MIYLLIFKIFNQITPSLKSLSPDFNASFETSYRITENFVWIQILSKSVFESSYGFLLYELLLAHFHWTGPRRLMHGPINDLSGLPNKG